MTDPNHYSFDEILAPMSADEFFAEYYNRKPLHIPAVGAKFSSLMDWNSLNSMLNMTEVWTPSSLQLVQDGEIMPAAQYCRPSVDSEGKSQLRPDAKLVTTLLEQGASLIANSIDTLTPGLAAIADSLESALNGKAQTNLYCSWRERRAFNSHFDTHDVFAIHTVGEKTWYIYEGRLDNPISHPKFKNFGQAYHETNKGKIIAEVMMRPGDLLYIPRGQYHDALASSDGTIHVSFGVTNVIGLDVLSVLYEQAVDDSLFRGNVPIPQSGGEAEYMNKLVDKLVEIANRPASHEALAKFRRQYRYRRGGFALPIEISTDVNYTTSKGLSIEEGNGSWVLTGQTGNVPIPPDLEQYVRWIISQGNFSTNGLFNAFPNLSSTSCQALLRDLVTMKVIRPI